MNVASDILPNPEQSEFKPLSLVSINDMNDDETPTTPEITEPKAELDDVADDATPVTPERSEPKSSKKSSFFGDANASNPRVEVRARYLDTSSGSCHDFCKYGHKNIKESTASFISKHKKKFAANSKPFSEPNGENFNQTLVAKKKILPANSTIRGATSTSMTTDKSNKKSKVKKSFFSPANSTSTGESTISVASDKSDKKLKVKKSLLLPANSIIRRVSSISMTSSKSDKKLNDVIQVSKGKKKELVPPNATFSVKPLIKRELKGKSENGKDLRDVSRLRKHSSSVGKGEKKQSLDEKTSEKKMGGDGIEMQNDEQMSFENKKGKQKSTVSITTGSSLISRNKNLSLKKVDRILSAEGTSTKRKKQMPKENVNQISSSWPKKVSKKVGLEEKIESAHKLAFKRGKVLDVKPNNTAPRRLKFKPRKVLPKDLNSKADDVASLKTQLVRQMTNPKIEINTRLKRVGSKKIGVEEKSEKLAHKLGFERGKVVDTAPRKLKFKPRKVIVENANGDKSRMNLKNFFGVDEAKGTNNEHLKVVLKHQDVEGKKDVQNLLNNVIEETATRLVRLRKSKVKALVGAFESLMSLPDAKSSTTSTS